MHTFIKIQKAGGTSLYAALQGTNVGLLEHCYSYPVGAIPGWVWHPTFPTFDINAYDRTSALVRNPFDILISYYHHTHNKSHNVDGWANCNIVHGFTSWEQFLEAYLDPTFEWHMPPMKKSMFSFAYDETGKLIITDFFKLEEPEKLNHFITSCGGTPMKKLNTSTIERNKKYYTADQVCKLKQIWKQDLEHFDYVYHV